LDGITASLFARTRVAAGNNDTLTGFSPTVREAREKTTVVKKETQPHSLFSASRYREK